MTDSKADLNQLLIFAKVVETQSFTAAGRALGLPKSTVSRKVAQLEERLGAVLLERTTRKLSLTEIGAAFHERCARIALEVEEAELAVQGQREPHGLLRVAASSECATTPLFELVSEFLLAHPGIDVELELSDRAVDMLEEGFDLWLVVGRPPASNLGARELGPVQRRLVASSSYVQRRGLPERPEQLDEHDLLLLGKPGQAPRFELGGRDGERVLISNRPRLWANDLALLHDAVRAGVGIGLLPSARVAEELEQGTLRAVLPDWAQADAVLHAVYPTARQLSGKVRRLLDYLSDRSAAGVGLGRAAGVSLGRAAGVSLGLAASAGLGLGGSR